MIEEGRFLSEDNIVFRLKVRVPFAFKEGRDSMATRYIWLLDKGYRPNIDFAIIESDHTNEWKYYLFNNETLALEFAAREGLYKI